MDIIKLSCWMFLRYIKEQRAKKDDKRDIALKLNTILN